MELIESEYVIKLSRAEILALQKGLSELNTLRRKYPNELNGYDLNSKSLVDAMHVKLNAVLGE